MRGCHCMPRCIDMCTHMQRYLGIHRRVLSCLCLGSIVSIDWRLLHAAVCLCCLEGKRALPRLIDLYLSLWIRHESLQSVQPLLGDARELGSLDTWTQAVGQCTKESHAHYQVATGRHRVLLLLLSAITTCIPCCIDSMLHLLYTIESFERRTVRQQGAIHDADESLHRAVSREDERLPRAARNRSPGE